MSPVGIRQALHHLYTAALLLLFATGLLLAQPDLRGSLVGGYGREILDIHLWVGWVFLGLPLLALLLAARPLLRDLLRRLGPPDGITWRKVHIALTLAAGLVLAATGLVLWLDSGFPLAVSDVAVEVHEIVSYLVIAILGLHLVAARRKIAVRTREIVLREREPHFPFDLDDDLEDDLEDDHRDPLEEQRRPGGS
ncbi:MAG: cytochrome b/b6 domain-containing protein [Deltaproteobacteria bacterium]|nr:cytochrome b/b6 domain-containing protein [Deltaproteobacteria bacterium]MBW2418414.1 cytochrome b/b6 domain-containing protein [Deltaproteobacteria bacterium]